MQRSRFSHKIFTIMVCLFLTFSVSACAQPDAKNPAYQSGQIADPLEPLNRGIFAVNNVIDIFVIEPVAKIYKTIFPGFVRDGVQNFMRNLRAPIIVANNLLQGNVEGAGLATARFVINSTAGIAGLIDVAADQGMPYVKEDFGQTLATWGLGDGFYIVLPIIGASSLRDTAGIAVDTMADPVRIIAHNSADNDWIYYNRVAIEGIDTRSRLLNAVRDLRQNSLDYYAAVRSAYGQSRQAEIKTRAGKHYTAKTANNENFGYDSYEDLEFDY